MEGGRVPAAGSRYHPTWSALYLPASRSHIPEYILASFHPCTGSVGPAIASSHRHLCLAATALPYSGTDMEYRSGAGIHSTTIVLGTAGPIDEE